MDEYLINKKYFFKGSWFFPKNGLEAKFSGTLEYNPDKTFSVLEVWAEKVFKFDNFVDEIILNGITVDGEKLTVTNLFCISIETTKSGQNITLYTFHVYGPILVGKHYDSIDDMYFTEAYYQFTGLTHFCINNRAKSGYIDDGLYIKYEKPSDVTLLKNDKMEHKVLYSYNSVSFGKNVKIETKEYFFLKSLKKYTLEEVSYHINVLNGFLIFFTNEKSHLTEIFTIEKEFKIYILNQFYREVEMVDLSEGMASHTLCRINDNIVNEKYRNWINLYAKQKNAMNKYFLLLRSEKYFVEEEFLMYTQLFEELHRNTNDFEQYKSDNDEHEEKIADILKFCPEEHIEWLKDKLKFSSEVNFSKRFSLLFKKYRIIFNEFLNINSKNRDRIIRKIVGTRNFYTHGSIESEENAEKNIQSIIILTKILKILIDCIIFTNLKYSDVEVNEAIYTKSEFYYLLYNVHREKLDWAKLLYL